MKFHVAKTRVLAEKTIIGSSANKLDLFIPETVDKNYTEATILSVGDEVTDWKVGDRVFFQKMSGFHFKYEGKELVMIPSVEIMAKMID